jgi:uncharacterized protein
MYNLVFDWDHSKDLANQRKHGIGFATAQRVFTDDYAVSEQDRVEGGEYRWRTIGLVDGVLLLLVAHTVTSRSGSEFIRIISARQADRSERRKYDQERHRTQHP